MKRIAVALLLLFCITPAASANGRGHVADYANILTVEQAEAIGGKLAEIYGKTQVDVLIVTTNDSKGMSAAQYALEAFEVLRNAVETPDGVMLVFCFDSGEYYELSRGKAASIFAGDQAGRLDGVLAVPLSKKDYAGALEAWAAYAENALVPASPFQIAWKYFGIAVILAVLIAWLITGQMKAKLKTAAPRSEAGEYLHADSLVLDHEADIFLYETVSHKRIAGQRENRSGSEAVDSKDGTKHSGQGGKLS